MSLKTLSGLPAMGLGGLLAISTAQGFDPGGGNGLGAFFWPDDWTLSDVQSDGNLRVDILNLLTDATDVEYKVDNGSWTSGGSTSNFTISGLTNDQAYLIYIRAAYSGGSKSAHMLPKKGIPTDTPSSTIYASASASGGGAGTSGDPYTLAEALSNMSGGETVVLKEGTYGTININTGTTYSGGVVIAAETPLGARINGAVRVQNADNVTFKNLYIAPDGPSDLGTIFANTRVESGCAGITYEGCKIQGKHDVSGFLSWDDTDWSNNVQKLVYAAASDGVTYRNCILHVGGEDNYPMITGGTNMTVEYCSARFSAADVYKINNGTTVRGCWFSDMLITSGGAHADIIQRDSPGGSNITIAGNILIEWTQTDVTPPTTGYGSAQGIGAFDGTNSNWLVENNVVINSSTHGISIHNGTGNIIRNNTIIDRVSGGENPTIGVAGADATVEVYNNITSSSITLGSATGGSNTVHAFAANATNYPGLSDFDARLASGNAALSNGDAGEDPAADIRGVTRDASTPARGALEDAYS